MPVFKINPNVSSKEYQEELAFLQEFHSDNTDLIQLFKDYGDKASVIPNGYIKKIVWDEEGGYPAHAYGVIQYSIRPYQQGYGCDGTTDCNIHLIASVICGKLGVDYSDAYALAYENGNENGCIEGLSRNMELQAETVIPEKFGGHEISLMLHDLYQINNRSLVEVIEEMLIERDIPVPDWH